MRALAATVILLLVPAAALAQGSYSEHALRAAFDRLDDDHDGFLSPREWGRHAGTAADLPLDVDGDGRISRAEFAETVWSCRSNMFVSVHPQAPRLLQQGIHELGLGRLEEASRTLAAAAGELQDVPRPWLLLAGVLQKLGQVERARDVLKRSVELMPNRPELWNRLAGCEELLGGGEGAREARRRAAALNAFATKIRDRYEASGHTLFTTAEALALRAVRSALDREHYPEALAAAMEARNAAPSDWRPPTIRASLLAARGSTAEARASLEEAAARHAPPFTISALGLGLLLDEGKRREALDSLRKLERSTTAPVDFYELAWQLATREEWGLAVPCLESCLLDPWYQRTGAFLLAVAFYELGQLGPARSILEQAELTATEPKSMRLIVEMCRAMDLMPQAIAMLRESLTSHPAPENWLCLAEAQGLAGDRPGQRDSLRKALENSLPRSPVRRQIEKALAGLPK